MKKTIIGLAIALAASGLTTTAVTANAASPACGTTCMTLSSEQYGSGYVVAAVTGRISIRNAPPGVALAAAGPYQSEDFKAEYIAPVSLLYSYGIVAAAVDQSWPNAIGYEYQYAPGGEESGLCLGTAGTAAEGTAVTLQGCGVSGQTVWVATSGSEFTPLVNGTDSRSFEPYVLTAGTDNGPLTVEEYFAIIIRGTSQDNKLWRAIDGVI